MTMTEAAVRTRTGGVAGLDAALWAEAGAGSSGGFMRAGGAAGMTTAADTKHSTPLAHLQSWPERYTVTRQSKAGTSAAADHGRTRSRRHRAAVPPTESGAAFSA
jgi:hypothetical protein